MIDGDILNIAIIGIGQIGTRYAEIIGIIDKNTGDNDTELLKEKIVS